MIRRRSRVLERACRSDTSPADHLDISLFAGRPIIGLAGGIGSGKSHVARLFEQFGCCRVDSDEMIRTAYTHPSVRRAVAGRFGEDVLDPSGAVDRRRLAAIVFNDPQQRRWLEELLHPIANATRVEVMDQAARNPEIVAYVWDSPLLFETRLNELCDTVVFVDADREDRLKRVTERGWDEAELARRENAQWPLDKKRALSDHCLSNAADAPATAETVRALLTTIVTRVLPETRCGGCGDGCACQRESTESAEGAGCGEAARQSACCGGSASTAR